MLLFSLSGAQDARQKGVPWKDDLLISLFTAGLFDI
jgi:hypothetical protein